jgi:hypothetical protein
MISASQRLLFVIGSGMSLDSYVVVSTEESERASGSRHAESGPSVRTPQPPSPPMTSGRQAGHSVKRATEETGDDSARSAMGTKTLKMPGSNGTRGRQGK